MGKPGANARENWEQHGDLVQIREFFVSGQEIQNVRQKFLENALENGYTNWLSDFFRI